MQHQLHSGPVPLYHQLKQALRNEIEQGVYKPGDRLPSEPELIREYGISRITVRQALDELEAEGLIIRRHGKGTYVAERRIEQDLVRLTDFVEDMQQAGLAASSQVLNFLCETATPAIAAALKMEEGAQVMRLERLRLADNRPIAFDVTWLPLHFGKLLTEEDLNKETIYHILETRYGIAVETGTFHITAAVASTRQASLLDVAPGCALLVIQRISYTNGGVPVYIQERYYRPDRVQYRVQLHRHGESHNGNASRIDEFRPVFEEDVIVGP